MPGPATRTSIRTAPLRPAHSLRSQLSNVVISGLAVMLLAAAVIQWTLANRSVQRHAAATLTGWARLGAVRAQEATRPSRAVSWNATHHPGTDNTVAIDAFRRWSRAVLAEPGILATAIIDYQGQILTIAPEMAVPADIGFVCDPHLMRNGGITRSHWHRQPVDVAHWPIDRGATRTPVDRVCIIARADRVATLSPTTGMFTGWAILALLAGGVVIWIRRRFDRDIVMPLDRITRTLQSDAHRVNVDELEAGATGELCKLDRAVRKMINDLDEARHRNLRLEASIETTVEQHTRRINLLLDRAKRDAQIDSLTGLANRRFIDIELDRVYAQQRKGGGHLAVIMLDLDNFKTLNDTEGHAAGDRVLQLVGELLRGTLRESDVAVRYGGDEFALVLADVSTHQAQAVAERNCRLFAQGIKPMNLSTSVSLSAGVASSFELDVQTGSELLAAADHALYESKRAGKDRVAIASA